MFTEHCSGDWRGGSAGQVKLRFGLPPITREGENGLNLFGKSIWQHLPSSANCYSSQPPPMRKCLLQLTAQRGNECTDCRVQASTDLHQSVLCTHRQWSRDRSVCSAQCGVQDSEGWIFTPPLNQHFLQAQVHPKCDSWRLIPNKQIPWTVVSSLFIDLIYCDKKRIRCQ